MIDFSPYRRKESTLQQLADSLRLDRDALAGLTGEMCDLQLKLIEDAEDADVSFVPDDPEANDTFADNPDDVSLPWTLGHVILHTTASSEEAAALALRLARGLAIEGRARIEVPWPEVHSADFLRRRLQESRRMRLAMLDAWPDQPHLETTYASAPGRPSVNAIGRFLGGLSHDDSHLDQIRKIVSQAHAARAAAPGPR